MLRRKYFSPRRLPNPVWFSSPLFTPGPDALVLTLTSHILTGGNSRKPNFISGVIRKAELLPLASHSTTESPGRLWQSFPCARNHNITNKGCQHLVKMSYPELALADERLPEEGYSTYFHACIFHTGTWEGRIELSYSIFKWSTASYCLW